MKKSTTLLLPLFLICLSQKISAQQDPIYAQYLNNPLPINPAYAGINNQFSARLQYRTQWAGIEANPVTANFSGNISILQNKMGAGLVVTGDKLGDIQNIEVSVPVSYKIKFNDTYLSFGMQAGFVNQSSNLDGLNIQDRTDQAFATFSETSFNLGGGLMLKNDKYRFGISAPRLVPAKFTTMDGTPLELYKQHYYLFGSYIFRMNDKLWFRPSVLLRGTANTPLSIDVNPTFTFREFYSAGIFTRNFKSYGALVQVVLKNFHLGYVFELPGSKDSSVRFTSHEITLGLSIGVLTYHDKVAKVF
jgi:type IX secretion system PorP/SprF family membrane protein